MKQQPLSGDPLPSHAHPYRRAAVIGAGAWGTALAVTLARGGVATRLWGRDRSVVDGINTRRRTERYLPDVEMPEGLHAVHSMAAALDGAEVALIVVPSRSVRSVARQVAEYAAHDMPVAVCAKGIEAETGLLMTQVAEEELGRRPVGCVSGPTFALETALGHPTAATVGFPFSYGDRLTPSEAPAVRLAVSLSTESFRAYVSDDLVGVEIGGAVKNVIAIACGVMTGAGFAENTRAALITRGLDEMKVLAEALGGRRETVTGLLAERAGESLTAFGLRSPEILLEVWTSPDSGSWTLLLSRADGVSCVLATGTDWQTRTPPPVMMGLDG